MSRPAFPLVPRFVGDEETHRRLLAERINATIGGNLNATADVTLTSGATSTVISDPRLSGYSFVDLMPLSANAATVAPSVWYSGQQSGSLTVNHASLVAADLHYTALIIS